MKTCSSCDNSPTFTDADEFCSVCGAALVLVTPVREEESHSGADEEVLICPKCASRVYPELPFCVCGEPVTNARRGNEGYRIPPENVRHESAIQMGGVADAHTLWIEFVSVAGGSCQCRNGDVLGRSGTLRADLFAGFTTVSSHHCLLQEISGRWFVIRLPTGRNSTSLDGVEMKPGVPFALVCEHTLQMSSRCIIRLIVKSPENQ
jgi:hypothetical protein